MVTPSKHGSLRSLVRSVKPRCDVQYVVFHSNLAVCMDFFYKTLGGICDDRRCYKWQFKDFRHLSLPCRTHRSRPVDWQEEVAPDEPILSHQTCRIKKNSSRREAWLYIVPTPIMAWNRRGDRHFHPRGEFHELPRRSAEICILCGRIVTYVQAASVLELSRHLEARILSQSVDMHYYQ